MKSKINFIKKMKYSFLLILVLIGYSFSYNAQKAYNYAKRWALDRNPNYYDYSEEGGDCANFVSQCLIAGGLSLSDCYGSDGVGGTVPYVPNLESCLLKKGWKSSSSIPSKGLPVGAVITFNSASHTALVVQAGKNPLIAGHTNNVWMGSSDYGYDNKYFWTTSDSDDSGDDDETGSIIWYPYVNGYNENDGNNGYAGEFGVPVVALKVKNGKYAVHEVGGSWITASNNDVAGKGNSIDGIAVDGGVSYKVHLLGGGWLPAVNKYDLNDSENGMAGIYGRVIDAIAINGKAYASAHN